MLLIVLAAGKGSRLPKKYRNNPKCLTKISNKSLLEHNLPFYRLFKKKIIITGYKSNKLKKFIKDNNFLEVKNHNYKTTNMVHSLFLATRYVKEDVVVTYGDIIFNKNIYSKLLRSKINLMPLNSEWLKIWKKRMAYKKIINDAENVEVSNKLLKSIGGKILGKKPKYQYMGIFKLNKKSFIKMSIFYKKIGLKKIDLTSFINKSLNEIKIKFKIINYKSFWFEIDTFKDIQTTSKYFK